MNYDGPGDNEDLWLKCFDQACTLLGWSDTRGFPARMKYGKPLRDRAVDIADSLYEHIKEKTAAHETARKAKAPVVQLKN